MAISWCCNSSVRSGERVERASVVNRSSLAAMPTVIPSNSRLCRVGTTPLRGPPHALSLHASIFAPDKSSNLVVIADSKPWFNNSCRQTSGSIARFKALRKAQSLKQKLSSRALLPCYRGNKRTPKQTSQKSRGETQGGQSCVQSQLRRA